VRVVARAYPRQNGLALALREIGRIERTLYALDWLEQPALRRQATAELNKGESHNALSRAVCFHRLGRLHDRTAQNQQHRASGLAWSRQPSCCGIPSILAGHWMPPAAAAI
jgi:TnpA family transposase